jgi:hypothetical protein
MLKIVWGRSIGFNLRLNGMEKFGQGTLPVMEYTIITDGADCYPWHEVYAWFPVKTITGKRVWMKKVFKRKVWIVWGTGFHMEPETQYATAFDMLNDPYERLSK